MKPESEWFRPPKWHQCCSYGDTQRWLLVAEVELHKIAGVTVETTNTDVARGGPTLNALKAAAEVELRQLIAEEIWVPEGSDWDTFKHARQRHALRTVLPA